MKASKPHSDAIRNILKALYLAERQDEQADGDALQRAAGNSDVAVVMRQLDDDGLTQGDPPRLTHDGEEAAINAFFQQSEAVENFLKAIYTLQQEQQSQKDAERVSTNALKDELNITAPSVTDMAQRLVEDGLVDYYRYRGVRLTSLGERVALKIIRRHRLIELFLVQELGYDLHEVHDEAENLEHAVSDRFIEAVADKLNHPRYDPHGDPIPAADGTIKRRELHPLTEIALHRPATVCRFSMQDAAMLQHVLDRGFALKTQVEVLARDPFEGPLTVRAGDVEIVIGHKAAAAILVEPISERD